MTGQPLASSWTQRADVQLLCTHSAPPNRKNFAGGTGFLAPEGRKGVAHGSSFDGAHPPRSFSHFFFIICLTPSAHATTPHNRACFSSLLHCLSLVVFLV